MVKNLRSSVPGLSQLEFVYFRLKYSSVCATKGALLYIGSEWVAPRVKLTQLKGAVVDFVYSLLVQKP